MALLGSLKIWQLVVVGLLVPIAYRIFRAAKDPLRDVPGPFLARFTRLWFLRAILKGDWERTNIALHRKHGPIVRVGPNMYSFDDPTATSTMYGTNPTFPKGTWYSVFQPPGEQHQNIYSSSNNRFSAEVRKKYKPAYDAANTYEYCIDECTELFISKLEEMSLKGEDVDIGWWVRCYASDANGQMMYGKRFGFLDEGKDIGNISTALEDRKNYGATIGIFPGFHAWSWLLIAAMSFVMRQIDYTLVFTEKLIQEHPSDVKKEGKATGHAAMLTRFLEAHNEKPEWFTHDDVLIGALTGIVAGGDTTEISFGATLHYLHENPSILEKLRAELDAANLSSPIKYTAAIKLPYLNAVIKEAQRMHSSAGTPLWRAVPKPGMTLSGKFFPAGTQVGVNIWVSQYSSAFDPDPDIFRPERWLEADANTLARMERSHMVYGVGPRNCQGEKLARMLLAKGVPDILRRFDFDITGQWRTRNNWFVGYKGLTGKVKKREQRQ